MHISYHILLNYFRLKFFHAPLRTIYSWNKSLLLKNLSVEKSPMRRKFWSQIHIPPSPPSIIRLWKKNVCQNTHSLYIPVGFHWNSPVPLDRFVQRIPVYQFLLSFPPKNAISPLPFSFTSLEKLLWQLVTWFFEKTLAPRKV